MSNIKWPSKPALLPQTRPPTGATGGERSRKDKARGLQRFLREEEDLSDPTQAPPAGGLQQTFPELPEATVLPWGAPWHYPCLLISRIL